jgi:hypothetical protein
MTLDHPPARIIPADLSRQLAALRAPIEQTFLSAGRILGDSVTAIGSITAAFHRLNDFLDSEALRAAAADLGGIAGGLTDAQSAGTRQGDVLLTIDRLAQNLDAPLGRLRRIIDEVRMLAVNARIEAAQVDGAGRDFALFTDEIQHLGDLAGASLEKLASELSVVASLANKASGIHSVFADRHRKALTAITARLDASLRALDVRRSAAATAATRIQGGAHTVEARIGDMILALQIGDLTRQRLEHAEAALAQTRDAAGTAGAVCRLQSMQLGNAEHELRAELNRLLTSLDATKAEADGIRRDGRSAFGSEGDVAGSFLHDLLQDLTIARDVLSEHRQAEEQLRETLRPVSSRLGEMVKHVENVRSIEADMRIMGLNATFKCSRLGSKGRVLGVIAQELRALARLTAEDAARVMSGLQDTFSMAQALSGDDQATAQDAIWDALTRAITAFEIGNQTLHATLGALNHETARAIALLDDTAAVFDGRDTLLGGLTRCAAEADAVATALGHQGHENFDDLLQSYTMASERAVHARFVGGAASAGTDQAASLDDILF